MSRIARTDSGDRIELVIEIAALILLVAGCFVVLEPFLSAILWAVILCFTTWPAYLQTVELCAGRRSLAALTMTIILAAVLIAPFVVVGASLAANAVDVVAAIRHSIEYRPAGPPAWIAGFPWLGTHLRAYWEHLAADTAALLAEARTIAEPLTALVLRGGAALGHGILHTSISLLICFFLYRDGETAAARLSAAMDRIAGDRGRRLLEVAAFTVRGVVYGLIGTALIQGALATLGFWIAGVPAAALLGFATFVVSVIPMAAFIIAAGAAIWLYYQAHVGAAIFILVWMAAALSGSEHIIKPVLMSRGGTTPILIMILGVFGGALAFGFIGLFLGPALLAIGYALLVEWSSATIPASDADQI